MSPLAFLVANIVSIAWIALATALLTGRLAARGGIARGRRIGAQVLVASLVVVMPMGLRWALFYPVLVDAFSLGMGLAWLLAYLDQRPWLRIASLPLAALAVLARETWLVIIVAVVLTGFLLDRNRSRVILALFTAWFAVGAAFVAFRAPSMGSYEGRLTTFIPWMLRLLLLTRRGIQSVAWEALSALGFFPLLLWGMAWRARRRDGIAGREAAGWAAIFRRTLEGDRRHPSGFVLLLVAAMLAVFFSSVLGSDVHRNLLPAVPLLTAFTIAMAAREPRLDLSLALCVLASLLLWRPFHVLDGTREGYFAFFSPYYGRRLSIVSRLGHDLLLASPALAAWLAVAMLRRRKLGPRGGGPPTVREAFAFSAG